MVLVLHDLTLTLNGDDVLEIQKARTIRTALESRKAFTLNGGEGRQKFEQLKSAKE